jgi:hypothetical protein
MPISPDISDLSWLHQPNPGEFGLRAMQVGLETGRSFVAARNANREQAREDAMLPLRQKFMDNQVKSMALDIKTKMDMQGYSLNAKEGMAKMAELARSLSENSAWHTPQAEAAFWAIDRDYDVEKIPFFQESLLRAQKAKAADAEIKRVEAETRRINALADAADDEPEVGEIELPDGTKVQYIKPPKGSTKFIHNPEAVSVTDPNTGKPITVLKTGPNSAKEVSTGLTTATKTKLEQQGIEGDRAVRAARRLAPLINENTTGIRGAFSRAVQEAGLAQLAPWLKIGEATEAASVSREFQAALVRELRSDSNIAEKEVGRILSGLPDVTDWSQSAQQAKVKLASKLEGVGQTSRANAPKLGNPITPRWLYPEEIYEMARKGEITSDKADEMLEDNAWILIQSLRQSAQQK